MAHFRGTIQGSGKSVASRLGTKKTDIVTEAQSWQGKIQTRLFYDEFTGRDKFEVVRMPYEGSGGTRVVIADGFVDTGMAK